MEPDPDEHQHPGEEELEWENESIKSMKEFRTLEVPCKFNISFR